MGYQPLMREALRRFAEAEMKRLAVKYANERRRGSAEPSDSKNKGPKVA